MFSAAPGTPITWSIGSPGQAPDHYPARILDKPVLVTDDRGRPAMIGNIIALRTNLNGEEYTSERLVNMRFCEPRTSRVEALDGTKEAPLSLGALIAKHQESVAAFQANRAETTTVEALTAVAALVD